MATAAARALIEGAPGAAKDQRPPTTDHNNSCTGVQHRPSVCPPPHQ
uniref:Uncharacterized protein n=1 Tax=Arundo donax TaxID=35708 RepID=A0A0A9AXE2_ARUDO